MTIADSSDCFNQPLAGENERSGVQVWKILKSLYQNSGDVWIISLTTGLYNLKLKGSQEVVTHLS